MVLYSAKTWVDISSYNSCLFIGTEYHRGLGFVKKLSYLGYLSLLIFKSSCLGIKSRQSSGH